MNYIIIDLEWNQCPLGRELGERDLPFEIIEIGAVKLDENRQIIGKFHSLIKPQVYKEIHFKTQEIVHINKKELMKKGELFPVAVRDFLEWCGEDYRFGTWGTMDLMELQRNMEYFGVTEALPKPLFYYDVQKLFSLDTEGHKNPHTLAYAVEYYELAQKEDFHRALADAQYTARVFQEISATLVNRYFSIDYYHNPKTKEEEIFVDYGTYTKFISREYETKEAVLRDRRLHKLSCIQCHKNQRKKINWFSNSVKKNYYCLGYCPEHGYLKGRMRIYKSRSGKYFAVKIITRITDEAARELRARYMELKKKAVPNQK